MSQVKTALVTGGTSGIGLAIACKFASLNYNVILVGSNPEKDYSEAVKRVSAISQTQQDQPWVKSFGINIVKESDVKELIKSLQSEHIELDVLVHGAGVFFDTPIAADSTNAFERMMAVNVNGMWNVIHAALPILKKGNAQLSGSKIVVLSSICSFYSFATYSAYCASKAAVTALTRTLALELGPMGININAIEPGRVETAMHDKLINDPAQADILRSIAEANPSKRAFSKPEDIAEITAFLASDAARALHGTAIIADEGTSLGIGA